MPATPSVSCGSLLRLSDRSFAVESDREGSSNVGVIVGEELTVVVDGRLTPTLGKELGGVVRELARLPAHGAGTIGVLTHHHGDHSFGMAAVGAGAVMASAWTCRALEMFWADQVDTFCRLRPHQSDSFREAQRVAPAIELQGAVRLHPVAGVDVTVEAIGHAHTPGDVVVWAETDQLCFVGDLIFSDAWPVLWDADVESWVTLLRRFEHLEEHWCLVPGHGPVGGPASATEMRRRLEFLIEESHRPANDRDERIAAYGWDGLGYPERVDDCIRRILLHRSAGGIT